MPFYHRLGEVPHKRHTQFRQADGSLYAEELVSSEGFSGIYSLLYHKYPPTRITRVASPMEWSLEEAPEYKLEPAHLKTALAGYTGNDFLNARLALMFNNDVVIGICNLAADHQRMDCYYKNGEADEILFFHEGEATLYSQFGVLDCKPGDYVVIPRTTIYRLEFQGAVKLLFIEAFGPVETPKRYRSQSGQLLEHSPFCERDIRPPHRLVQEDEKKDYIIKVKKQGYMHEFHYDHSPLDVVGWDGHLFPYCLSIHDFEPITGRIHQPPPVHQTFQAHNFVVCSFVPRLFDYHPQGIPAPYNHSNIDSDEVLYYVEGNFMSRKGVDRASFTLHPGGLPHGPHPGTVEASIGAKETLELAVMIDTFRPLKLTRQAMQFFDKHYPLSWL